MTGRITDRVRLEYNAFAAYFDKKTQQYESPTPSTYLGVEEDLVLAGRPSRLLDRGIEVVEPALTALLAQPPGKEPGQFAPLQNLVCVVLIDTRKRCSCGCFVDTLYRSAAQHRIQLRLTLRVSFFPRDERRYCTLICGSALVLEGL